MTKRDYKADIVVSVSGGIVNGVFGPEGATVLLVDFDNIREGDDMSLSKVDGTPDSRDCQNTIKEAMEMIARHETQQSG